MSDNPVLDKVTEIVTDWSNDVIQELKDRAPRASSQLFQSIAPIITVDGAGVTLEIIMEDYWEDADLGIGASKNPKQDYLKVKKGVSEWVNVKPEIKSRIKAEGGNYDSNRRGAIFLITRSILKYGTKNPPSYFFSEVLGDLPLNPKSERRMETNPPQGMGKFKELTDDLSEALKGSIIIELKK